MALSPSAVPNSPDPAAEYMAYTPSGTTDAVNFGVADTGKTKRCRAIRVGTAGNVEVVREDGVAVIISNVQAGETLPVVAIRINSGANTTASNFTIYF